MSSTWEVEPRPGSTMSARPLLWNCLPSRSLHSGFNDLLIISRVILLLFWTVALGICLDGWYILITLSNLAAVLYSLLNKLSHSFQYKKAEKFPDFSSLFPFWLIIFLKSFLSLHFTVNGLEKPGHSFNSLLMYFFSQITNFIVQNFWILLSTKQ